MANWQDPTHQPRLKLKAPKRMSSLKNNLSPNPNPNLNLNLNPLNPIYSNASLVRGSYYQTQQ